MLEQAFIVSLAIVGMVTVLFIRRKYLDYAAKHDAEIAAKVRETRLKELNRLIALAIKEEDKVFEIYKKLAKRERRGEQIPDGEIWEKLQTCRTHMAAYGGLCGRIEVAVQLMGHKLRGEVVINRVRLGLDPLIGGSVVNLPPTPAAA
ncbi:hypothetical protein IT087_01615 [Candidatus Uhrbacteria bacterium]|nr:hypothetical protein [Candidatus Uhrbacteria bacterium]